ncbi:aldehyde dehydrogenase (NADP(+)) [Roseivirga sp.]|uniref:aldehyde dehydrogenase (NADP(+)) n=1 Tax=Roseivirga sp. TaxID=1964215 RepID=UPI003B8D5C9D
MITGKNYIGNDASSNGNEVLKAYNPADGSTFTEDFFAATPEEINAAVEKAQEAFGTYKAISYEKRAQFLETIAEEIMSLGDTLLERASGESGLPLGRFQGERGRTCNQLKMFAGVLRDGSWLDVNIDTAILDRQPIPKVDLRKIQIPLGPVAVFGASNFPLAFSTAGGDTASALAAGNPVIVKGHEAHLGTNDLVSQAVLRAVEKCGMPDGTFSMVNGGISAGQQLVKHPKVKAVGFTGSLRGGRAIFDLANQRPEPIPVYAEMGSTNPSFLMPDKLSSDPEGLGNTFANSVALGVGQFCTSPGLLIGVKSTALDQFIETLSKNLAAKEAVTMLNEKISTSYYAHRGTIIEQTGVEIIGEDANPGSNKGKPLTAKVSAAAFLENPKLHEEIFGPFTMVVACEDTSEMLAVANAMHGQLTGTMVATENDMEKHSEVADALSVKVGRILFNGVPTGVEVCHSMQHGGPYPASTDQRTTSVGTAAISRFARPISYQNWPDHLLPDALKNNNPLNIWRTINGTLTKAAVS